MSIPTQLNNPGDLRPTDSSQPTQDTSSGTFRTFDNPGKGFEALLNDLQSKISGKSKSGLGPNSTLSDFSSVYAPESDNNNSGQYTVNLANQMKVRPDTKLSELQPRIGDFAKAVATNEGYQWADQPADPNQPAPQKDDPYSYFGTMGKDFMNNLPTAGPAAVAGGLGVGFLPEIASLLGYGGATAATTAATEGAAQTPGLLSKVFGYGKEAVKDSAIGLGIDKAAGLIGLGGESQQPQDQQQTQQPQQNNSDILSSLQPQIKASQGLHSGYQDSLNTTIAGRAFLQDQTGKDALLGASISGRSPDTSSGFNDFTQAEKERQAEAKATAKMEEVLVGTGNIKTSDAAKIAMQYLPSSATPKEREAAIRHIKAEASSYGGSVSLARGIQARHQQYASTKGKFGEMPKPSAHIMAHKALAKGFREAVKAKTPHKELYEKLLKHQQNLKNEQKMYKILNKKKSLPTNAITKSLHKFGTRMLATYVGDRVGGVLGAVLGNVVLSIGQKSADKHFGKNIFESPQVRAGLKILKEELPTQYDMLKQEMERKGIKFPNESEKGNGSEEGLIKEMKKSGTTKSEKVLTKALKKTEKTLKKQLVPQTAKSNAIKKKLSSVAIKRPKNKGDKHNK